MWRELHEETEWRECERPKLEVTDCLPSGLRDLPPIELVAELYMGDFSASEMAHSLALLVRWSRAGCSTYGLLQGAWWLSRIVAHLGKAEDFELSTQLLRMAKRACYKIVLLWLDGRGCPCCEEIRSKVEEEREREKRRWEEN